MEQTLSSQSLTDAFYLPTSERFQITEWFTEDDCIEGDKGRLELGMQCSGWREWTNGSITWSLKGMDTWALYCRFHLCSWLALVSGFTERNSWVSFHVLSHVQMGSSILSHSRNGVCICVFVPVYVGWSLVVAGTSECDDGMHSKTPTSRTVCFILITCFMKRFWQKCEIIWLCIHGSGKPKTASLSEHFREQNEVRYF